MSNTKETLKQATAYAYGYSLVMLQATNPVLEDRLIRCQNLLEDARSLGILAPDGKNVTSDYIVYQVNGAFAAAEQLEAKHG